MKNLREIVESINQHVQKSRTEFIAVQTAQGKEYPNWGEFKPSGIFTLLEFCKEHGYQVHQMQLYIRKLYELNGLEYTHMTVTNSTYLNEDYGRILLELLGKVKYYNERMDVAAAENNVPVNVAKWFCPIPSCLWDEDAVLFKAKVGEAVAEIKSWTSLEDVAKQNNLDLEATLISGERIVGRILYENYQRQSYIDEKRKALIRRVVTPIKAKELIEDSSYWVTVGELSEAIHVPVHRIINTYDKERRKQIALYPLRERFSENTVISEMDMIEKIAFIETKVNPFRNMLEEEVMESKVGTVPNPPNSVFGKYLAKKGRKGHGHF
ncbi:hypothetical protein D3C78_659360 [compost metagenome]